MRLRVGSFSAWFDHTEMDLHPDDEAFLNEHPVYSFHLAWKAPRPRDIDNRQHDIDYTLQQLARDQKEVNLKRRALDANYRRTVIAHLIQTNRESIVEGFKCVHALLRSGYTTGDVLSGDCGTSSFDHFRRAIGGDDDRTRFVIWYLTWLLDALVWTRMIEDGGAIASRVIQCLV